MLKNLDNSLSLRFIRRVLGTELSRAKSRQELRDTLMPALFRVLSLPQPTKELLLNTSSYSMVSLKRLLSIYSLGVALHHRVPGVFAEFGVARGGTAGLIGTLASRQGRETWLFDSFQGLPEPDARDGLNAAEYASDRADGNLQPIERCATPLEDVSRTLQYVFGLNLEAVHFVKGWFQETRPAFPDLPIALLHLDGDWYASTRFVLENYFELVSPGGVVIIDDYGWWQGCRRAVDEFMADRGLLDLVRVGSSQAYIAAPPHDA